RTRQPPARRPRTIPRLRERRGRPAGRMAGPHLGRLQPGQPSRASRAAPLVSVVADSHALVWYAQRSPQLSARAVDALADADANGGLVVSVAPLIDLSYVSQSTRRVGPEQLAELRSFLVVNPAIQLQPIDLAVVDAYTTIDRALLTDPWERFIVATAHTHWICPRSPATDPSSAADSSPQCGNQHPPVSCT